MYDLDKKLLDLNNQILSYRLAMNRSTAIDPFTNPIAPPIVSPQTPTAVEPTPVSNPVEEKKEESLQKAINGEKGPRGKRGKRGPKGEQGPAGKDFDPVAFTFNTKIITTTYNASNEDCFVLVQASSNIEIILPDDTKDGKLMVIKNGNDDIITTIKTDSGAMIDGEFSFELSEPNETLMLVCCGGDWFVVGNYLKSF